MKKITIALADDHHLVRDGFRLLIGSFDEFEVLCEASNGEHLIENLEKLQILPDIALIDVSMPVMDGFDTIRHLMEHYKSIKCIALSVHKDFNSVFRMIDNGAKGYLLKDTSPQILKETILEVFSKGISLSSFVLDCLLEYKKNKVEISDATNNLLPVGKFSEQQLKFIIKCCSDLAYKQIAVEMQVSKRTIDGYREVVFNKLGVKSRAGILLYAFNIGIYRPKVENLDSNII